MALQIKGNSGTNLEVETNTRAARVTIRPIDYGSLGSYSHGALSGTITAGLSANAPIYSFRWTNATALGLIRRVAISAGNTATPFTAGVVLLQMFVARSFTAPDTGGNDLTPAGNDCKRRTSMGNSLLVGVTGSIRCSSTVALTPGTRTLDQQPCATIGTSVPATAGTPLVLPGSELWTYNAGDSRYPLVLAQNEGFVIQATVPASGTWTFGVSVDWDEILTANYF